MPLSNVHDELDDGFSLAAYAALLEPHEYDAMKDDLRQLVQDGAGPGELDEMIKAKGWPEDAARQALMDLVLGGDAEQTPEGLQPANDTLRFAYWNEYSIPEFWEGDPSLNDPDGRFRAMVGSSPKKGLELGLDADGWTHIYGGAWGTSDEQVAQNSAQRFNKQVIPYRKAALTMRQNPNDPTGWDVLRDGEVVVEDESYQVASSIVEGGEPTSETEEVRQSLSRRKRAGEGDEIERLGEEAFRAGLPRSPWLDDNLRQFSEAGGDTMELSRAWLHGWDSASREDTGDVQLRQTSARDLVAESFDSWFTRFLDEKQLPHASWDLEAPDGTWNSIDSDVVIEAIRGAPPSEQQQIKDMIVRIDFANGDVNDYFKHLAQALVNQHGSF